MTDDVCACGKENATDIHRLVCEEVDTIVKGGECPMCGKEYHSLLDHLHECDGGRPSD